MHAIYVSTMSDADSELLVDGIPGQEGETFLEIGTGTIVPGTDEVQIVQFRTMQLFVLGIIIGILLIGGRFRS